MIWTQENFQKMKKEVSQKKAILTRWPKGNEMLDIDDMLQSIRVGR